MRKYLYLLGTFVLLLALSGTVGAQGVRCDNDNAPEDYVANSFGWTLHVCPNDVWATHTDGTVSNPEIPNAGLDYQTMPVISADGTAYALRFANQLVKVYPFGSVNAIMSLAVEYGQPFALSHSGYSAVAYDTERQTLTVVNYSVGEGIQRSAEYDLHSRLPEIEQVYALAVNYDYAVMSALPVGHSDAALWSVNLHSGEITSLTTSNFHAAYALAFNPITGDAVALFKNEDCLPLIGVYDLASGALMIDYVFNVEQRHCDSKLMMSSLQFTQDGKYLVMRDVAQAGVWDAETGNLVAVRETTDTAEASLNSAAVVDGLLKYTYSHTSLYHVGEAGTIPLPVAVGQ